MDIKFSATHRGFALIEFADYYGDGCNIQQSSIATDDCIWLGISEANPKIMASKTPQGGTGWVPFEIPKDVLINTRMHLSREQVKELLPILQHFADTGDLPDHSEDGRDTDGQ